MADSSPWTQSIKISWRPELSFYEKRVAILKAFEEQGVLRAFRVEESSVDAQLFESRDRLNVRQNGLDLYLGASSADEDRAMEALKIALDAVQPQSPWHLSYSSQYIEAIDLSFEDAVQAAYGSLLGSLSDTNQKFGDWALLVDLELGEFPSTGQMEFGLIQADEAARRLSRDVGKMGGGSGRNAQNLWRDAAFPPVALFADGRAEQALGQKLNAGLLATTRDFWNASNSELGALVKRLHSVLLTNDLRRVESG